MKRLFARGFVRIFAITMLVLAVILFVVPLVWPLPPVGVDAAQFAEPDGAFIEVNGLSTYYRSQGPVDGPPVLLLHGWGGSTFSWRDTLPALAEAGYRAIAFDRPPYGLSAKTGDDLPYSQQEMADFTVAFMDALNIERAVLIGHSQGGGVIGYTAVSHPDRIAGLVFVAGAVRIADPVVDTAAENTTPARRGGGMFGVPPELLNALDFPPFERWARILVRGFVRPDMFVAMQRTAYYNPTVVTAEVAAGYQEQLQVLGWDEALLNIVRGTGAASPPLTADALAGITAPVLITWGEDDTWVPITAGDALFAALPAAQFIRYPQTGHMPMEERPAQFNQDVLAFLAGVYAP